MWQIYAYHNSVGLFGMFNALAAVMQSASYMGAIGLVALIGCLVAMFAYALAPEKLHGWWWLASVVLVYSVLLVPKVTVQIIDKTGGGPPQVVDNVPLGLAALASLSSSLGNGMTELFETAFQVLPGPGALASELAYQQTGLMFGSRIVQSTRTAAFPDPAFRADLLLFLTNCTAYDIADGTIDAPALSTSDDIWTTLSTTNPGRFSRVMTAGGIAAMPCDIVYANLTTRMGPMIAQIRTMISRNLNPNVSGAIASTLIDDQIYAAYTRSQIAAASSTASSILTQNAMINAINDAAQLSCQQVSDPSCMLGATARANSTAQQNSAWINGAKIAEGALPIFRNSVEALLYGIFPLVLLMLFLSSGKTTLTVLMGYVTALISIQLWPPLFAVLNYMATLTWQTATAAAGDLGAGVGALTARTADPIYSGAISSQAVVSYLITLIPFLSWALANRMSNFGATFLTGFTAMQGSVANASAASAVGNVSMGNVSMDQQTVSPMRSNAFVSSTQARDGSVTTTDGTGRRALKLMTNEGVESFMVTQQATQSDVQSANHQVNASKADMLSASDAQGSALNQAFTRMKTSSSSSSSGAGGSQTSSVETTRAFESLSTEASRIAKGTEYSESQVASVMLKFAATPSVYGIGGGAALEQRYGAGVTETERKILERGTAETARVAKSFADRVTTDKTFLNRLSEDGQAGTQLASSLTRTTNRVHSAERKLDESTAYAEQVQTAYTSGISITRDLAKDPAYYDYVVRHERLARENPHNPQALQAAWNGDIGGMQRLPTVFRSGAHAPASAGEVRTQATRDRADAAVNPNVTADAARNDQAVREGALKDPGRAPSTATPGPAPQPQVPGGVPTGSDIPKDVEAEAAANKKKAADEAASFDDRHQLERLPNGGVRPEGSLRNRAVGMLGDDLVETERAEAHRREREREHADNSSLQKDIKATPEVPAMRPSGGKRPPRP